MAQRKAAEMNPKKTESKIMMPAVTIIDHEVPSFIPRYAIGRGISKNTTREIRGM